MSRTIKNQHRLLNALREHGTLILVGLTPEEGYFAPGKDPYVIPNKAMSLAGESGAIIRMDGSKPGHDTFEHLIGLGGKVSTSLIFMAGADMLKPIEEFDAPVEEKEDNLSHRTIKGTWELSEEALSPKIRNSDEADSVEFLTLLDPSIEGTVSEFKNSYIALLGGFAVAINIDLVKGENLESMKSLSDEVFFVLDGGFYKVKSTSAGNTNRLSGLIINRRIIVIKDAVDSWKDFHFALLHCVESSVLASTLPNYNARALWM